ncbi:MAG: mannose-1-phosphate guanylyltransferase/mannose-6-phosphate isomerase [Pseudomonadota bacterium]
MSRTIYPVILVGGRGARLWPMSRESLPKVFQNLATDQSLLQDTATRLRGMKQLGAPIVVCNHEHTLLVAEQLSAFRDLTILAEPVRRNTAPAVVASAAFIQRFAPDALMLVLPADHVITKPEAFQRAIEQAAVVADTGRLVTFGIEPTEPETEYGYIKAGASIPEVDDAREIARFVEKPDRARAQALLAEGDHYWNSGMFVFPVRAFLDEVRTHASDVVAAAAPAVPLGAELGGIHHLDEKTFARAPSISVDYAVMEQTTRSATVPCAIGWSDVGNWQAIWELGSKDTDGNVLVGDAVSQENSNSFLRSDGPLVVGIGLEDTIVVATPDAVLVGAQREIKTVNRAVDRLLAEKRRQAERHLRAHRPWGYCETIQRGPRFQVQRLRINPGARLSLQKHYHRAEHWVIVEGSGLVTRDGEEMLLSENEATYIPLGTLHRIANPGNVPLTLIETQYGSYLDEDDVVRIEDDYGRADIAD